MATFTNQATLTYNGILTVSNIVTGELVEELSMSKTAVSSTYNGEDVITYVVNIINSGTTDYTGLTLTDNLGEYVVGTTTNTATPLDYQTGTVKLFTNGTLSATPTVASTSPLTLTGITVPAGGNVAITYSVKPNSYAPLGTTDSITNVANASGGGLTTALDASETITPEQEPNLSITKSANPTTVTENGTITYTFVINNTGNTAAVETDNVVITDTFDPVLTLTSVTLNGVALPETTGYTYNSTSGAFATVAGQITVPAATYTQDATTGLVTTTPGQTTLVVTGTI